MLKEYDIVRLRSRLPDTEIAVGAKGVVLIVYNGKKRAYEVEFVDMDGNSLGIFTTDDNYIEKWIE